MDYQGEQVGIYSTLRQTNVLTAVCKQTNQIAATLKEFSGEFPAYIRQESNSFILFEDNSRVLMERD